MSYKLPKKNALAMHNQALKKAVQLGHVVVSGEYTEENEYFQTSRKAILVVKCSIHLGEPIETTYNKYLRARNGLPCCGKEEVSKKLKNRQFTTQTIEKMSKGAVARCTNVPRSEDSLDRSKL